MRKFQRDLNIQIEDLKSYRVQPRLSRKYIDYTVRNSMDNIIGCVIEGAKAGLAFGFAGGFIAVLAGFRPNVYLPILKTIFFYGPITGFIVCIIGGFLIGCLMNKSERNGMIRENQEIDEQNAIIDKKNKEERERCDQKAGILLEEVNILNNSIKEIEGVLDKYYSKNVVYPKYRNFVAIASFYEYFSSERCYELEGHEGACNFF